MAAMEKKTLTLQYTSYSSIEELIPKDRELLENAIDALKGSYAPYSRFNVGAAVKMRNGIIVKGSNQENAAYPSGLCAERTAMFSAAARYPNESIGAIALIASQNGKLQPEPSYPCGACRQVMAQYQQRYGKPIKIIVGSAGRIEVFDSVENLMPFIFDDI